jgi:putative PIN family toxin of toxin-antitoxin system
MMSYALSFRHDFQIVVDTNVFISALMDPKGPSRELIRRCLLGDYQPLMGTTLFCEYESVTSRAEILNRCLLTPVEIADLLAAFISVTEWVQIYYMWRPNLNDEGDNHVIELAIAGNAQIIATNNLRDFQGAELVFPNLAILKPEQVIGR